MLKKLFFSICLVSTLWATAQKEANIWYFGSYAGLDFNSGTPIALTNGKLSTQEGCATISDSNGDLLFYTDGTTVWNKNHQVMLNGTGLKGHTSSTHSALIVPKPNSSSIYYIFTVDQYGDPNGFRYSKVDLQLDGGLGGIVSTEKNIFMLPDLVTEKVTAVKHANNNDYWVVSHKFNSDEFVAFQITDTGINFNPVVSKSGAYVGDHFNRAIGAIKISPNGKKLACANGIYIGGSELELFDFDTSTGIVSNPITIKSNNYPGESKDVVFYGVEFSQNSNCLYASAQNYVSFFEQHNFIFQFNLLAGSNTDIINSKVEIYKTLNIDLGALQLATNGKIYVSVYESTYLDAINNPNELGAGCNYQVDAVFLNGKTARVGLPPFIQSYFNIQDVIFEDVCFGDTTAFSLPDTVDAVVWDFGDPVSGVNNMSTDFDPVHVFLNPGTYDVSVTATVGTETATKTATVTIYDVPTATQPTDLLICDDNNDGIFSFDLTQQDSVVLNGQDPSIFEVVYYASMLDFTNNQPISDPTGYSTMVAYAPENIIASIRNKNNVSCEDITNFNVQVFESPTPNQNITNLAVCDNTSFGTDDDGLVQFDLTKKESEILNGQSAIDFDIKYFTDSSMLNEITTPSKYENTNISETIYIQVLNKLNPLCVGTTSFEIEVLELPIINPIVDLKQCDDDLDGFSAFNLNEVIPKITTNAINETIAFFENQADAESSNNQISNVTNYVNQTVSSDTVWARVENSDGCYRTSQVNLLVTTTQIPNTFSRDFYVCDDDLDGDSANGISAFDFSNVDAEIQAMFPVNQQLTIAYYKNEADALAENDPIIDITNYRNIGYPNEHRIYVRVDGQLDNDCLGLGAHINLYVEPQPVAFPVFLGRQCDDGDDEEFPFDVSQVESTVLNGQSLNDVTVTYFDENNNPLPSPLPDPFLTSSQMITIRVTNKNVTDGSCYNETQLEFIVDKQPIAFPVENQIACDDGPDDTDGFHDFDTSLIEPTVLNGQTGMEVHYYDALGTELPSPLPNPFVSESQIISVEVINPLNLNCIATTNVAFIVNPLPEFSIVTPQIVCSSDPTFTVVLDPLEDNSLEEYNYEWVYEDGTILSNVPTLTVSTPGTYSITLTKTDGTGCSRTREVFVNASELATITLNDITIVDVSSNKTVTINTNNLEQGDYEFALDNGFSFYQDEPVFENVSSGIHTLYVRDKKGCGTSSIDISIIGFPRFFTPNGDGNNDTWQIAGVNGQFQAHSDIYIYDRYGKLIKQLNPGSNGWDGTFNGQLLATDDYWFSVILEDGREFKGHFALKR